MKKCLPVLLVLAVLLTACVPMMPPETTQTEPAPVVTVPSTVPTTVPVTETTVPPTTEPPATEPPATEPATAPLHSEFFIPGVSVEDVILWFNEVVLAAEFVYGGNPGLLQKWEEPIYYSIDGMPTEEDLMVLEDFCWWLNTIEGFPGIFRSEDPAFTNLQIHFCSEAELISIMGDNFYGTDGGVTFWYTNNAIYDAVICYRNDIDQYIRNSVILEEIYNGLGPVQDTWTREDSLVYAGYSTPQYLTIIDQLILQLTYHPDMRCGMTAEECEAVIRDLYY